MRKRLAPLVFALIKYLHVWGSNWNLLNHPDEIVEVSNIGPFPVPTTLGQAC